MLSFDDEVYFFRKENTTCEYVDVTKRREYDWEVSTHDICKEGKRA
jgi:hypothetical protein